jgi:hypothetical protein
MKSSTVTFHINKLRLVSVVVRVLIFRYVRLALVSIVRDMKCGRWVLPTHEVRDNLLVAS